MQALPPTPAVQQCVRAMDGSTIIIAFAGPAKAIDQFEKTVKRHPIWTYKTATNGSGRVGILVLQGPETTPYREIGGLIYEAQRQRLAIVTFPSPQLCESKVK